MPELNERPSYHGQVTKNTFIIIIILAPFSPYMKFELPSQPHS